MLAVLPAQDAPPGPLRPVAEGISVVDEGVVTARPEIARLTLGVEVFHRSLGAAQADASARLDAVIRRLRTAGIPDADIRTASLAVDPQYDVREDQPGVLLSYRVQHLVP